MPTKNPAQTMNKIYSLAHHQCSFRIRYITPNYNLMISQHHLTNWISSPTGPKIIWQKIQYNRLHAKYVAGILRETTIRLKRLPNLNQASTAISKQVTICGDLHGKLDDLLVVFHKVSAIQIFFHSIIHLWKINLSERWDHIEQLQLIKFSSSRLLLVSLAHWRVAPCSIFFRNSQNLKKKKSKQSMLHQI